MSFLAILAAALQPAPALPLPSRTPFVAMLSKARLEVDCLGRRCPAIPVLHDPAEVPSDDYSVAFRVALTGFLLQVAERKTKDPDFTEQDYRTFQAALNVLPDYWACLEAQVADISEDRGHAATVDRIAAQASDDCRPQRELAMRRISFDGPDFASFDPAFDNGKPQADVSEELQKLQQFVFAYYSELPR